MDAANKLDNVLLDEARALVDALEDGNVSGADDVINNIGKLREQSLFQELGKMTRQLHEAINGFSLDSKIQDLTKTDIPDAKARLDHVITMTEDSANRTLTAVEKTIPVSESLKSKADDLHGKWDRFCNKDMNVDEFREMSKEISGFLSMTSDNANEINANLSEVMMAQEFQDLTGQILRRVISMVQEVEDNLVDLIRLSGGAPESTVDVVAEENTKTENLEQGLGPAVPGTADTTGSVSGQDEVDDLLSSLGF